MFVHHHLLRLVVMVLSCPAAIVALFILELNSTLYHGLPTDMSTTPLENHELVVSGTYSQGSPINSSFNNVHILHVQQDPAYNPYFTLGNQSGMLHSKIAINVTQENMSDIGTFLMAVNKHNKSQVEALYCVTYCIGSLTDPSIHEACYDSVSSEALHNRESLLSQNIYERNISNHAAIGDNVLQLALTPGNKSNVSFAITECNSRRLFFVDHHGVLRIGRYLFEDDVATHMLTIAAFAKVSDVLQVDLAWVTVKVKDENAFPATFEKPDGYTFSVKEGEEGLSVGFVKAVDPDVGLGGRVTYSFEKQQDTSLFQINQTSGEIKTAKALDRETAESHVFTVVASDLLGGPKCLSSQVEVHVIVDDINDNRPVFKNKEYALSLSLYTQPGSIISLEAEDKDIGKNAKMAYTIIQGNDNGLFWINSSSGELFLVAPLTVTANDTIELVVEVVDTFSTNTSFQDTTVVRMTFYDVTSPSARGSSDAVIAGSSVGGVLFFAVVVAVSLWIWKRRKEKRYRRAKHEALPAISTDQMPFDYERKICTVGDTSRSSSSEIYPPLRMSPVKWPSLSCRKGSQVTLDGSEMESETSSPLGSPRERAWSFSPVSELSALRTIAFQSSHIQGSQVSLDLSAVVFELHPALSSYQRTYDRSMSFSEPSTPTKECRRGRRSHVSLDLTGMTNESFSAPPTPQRRTSAKEWRNRRGSRVSLDFSQMESELSSSPQAPKERYKRSSSPVSPSTVSSRSSVTNSQVSLDLSCVEAPQSAKQESESSLSEKKAGTVYSTTLPTSAESTEGRLPRSLSYDSFINSTKGDFDITGDDTFETCIGSLSSGQLHQSQDFQSEPSIELLTLQESTSSLYYPADEESMRSSKSDTLEWDTRDQTRIQHFPSFESKYDEMPRKAVSLPILVGNADVTLEGGIQRQLSQESLGRSVSLPAIEFEALESQVRSTEEIPQQMSSDSLPISQRMITPLQEESVSNIAKSSQLSLDICEMQSDTKFSIQTTKQRTERSLSDDKLIDSTPNKVSASAISKSSQDSLDLNVVEPEVKSTPKSPKQRSKSSLSECKQTASLPTKQSTGGIAKSSEGSQGFCVGLVDQEIPSTSSDHKLEDSSLETTPISRVPTKESLWDATSRGSLDHRAVGPELTSVSTQVEEISESQLSEIERRVSPREKTSTSSIVHISHLSLDVDGEENGPQSKSQSSKQRSESSKVGQSSSLPAASESTISITDSSPINLHLPVMESESQHTMQYLKQGSARSRHSEFKALPPREASSDNEEYPTEKSDHNSGSFSSSAESAESRPPRSSLADSFTSSGSSEEDVVIPSDNIFVKTIESSSSLQSNRSNDVQSKPSNELGALEETTGPVNNSADKESNTESMRSSKPATFKRDTRDETRLQHFPSFESRNDEIPHETVSRLAAVGSAENITLEGGVQSLIPLQSFGRSVPLPAKDFDAVESHIRSTKENPQQMPHDSLPISQRIITPLQEASVSNIAKSSQVSLDICEMQSDSKISLQTTKKRTERSLSDDKLIASPPAKVSTSSVSKSSQDSLNVVEPEVKSTHKSPEERSKSSLSGCKQTALPSTKESTSIIAKISKASLDLSVSLADPDIPSCSSEHKLEDSSSKTTPISRVPAKDSLWDEISRGSLDHGAIESELTYVSPHVEEISESQLPEIERRVSPRKKTSTPSIVRISHLRLDVDGEENRPQSISQSSKQRFESSTEDQSSSLPTSSVSTSSVAGSSPINLRLPVMESESQHTMQYLIQGSARSCESEVKALPPREASSDNEEYPTDTSDHTSEKLFSKNKVSSRTFSSSAKSTEGRPPRSSSADSFTSSGSSQEDVVIARDNAFVNDIESSSSLQSNWSKDVQSKPSIELGKLEESTDMLYYSADKESNPKSMRPSNPATLERDTRDQTPIQHFPSFELENDKVPRRTVSPLTAAENAENITLEGNIQRLLPIQSYGRSVPLPAKGFDEVASQIRSTVEFPQQMPHDSLPISQRTTTPLQEESVSNIAKSSQVSLDICEMQSDTKISLQTTKKRTERSLSDDKLIASPPAKVSTSSVSKSSQDSLNVVEPEVKSTHKSPEERSKSSLSGCKQTALPSTKESTSSIAKISKASLDFSVGLTDPDIPSSSSEHKLEDSSSKTTPISRVPTKDSLWDEISRGSLDHGAMESEFKEELVSNIAKSSPVSLDVCEMQSDTKISLQTTKKRTERSLSDDKHIASPLTKASTSSISKSSQDSLNLNVVEAEVKSSPKSLKQRSKSLLSECKRTALLSTKESTSSIAKSSEANLDLSVGLVNPEIPSSPSEHKLGGSSSETSPIFSVPTKELLRDEISRGSLDHHAVESELTSLSPHMEETSKSQLSEIERKSSLLECKQTALPSTKESTSSIAKISKASLDFNVGLVDPEIPSSSSEHKLEDSSSKTTPISRVPTKDSLWDEISRGSLDHGAMESELKEELVSNIAKSSPVSLDVCEMQSDTKISLQTTKKRTERSLSDDKHIASPLTKASTSSISKSSQDSLNLNVVEAEVKSSPKSLKQRSKSLLSECKRTALLSTKESTSSIAKSSEANPDLSVGLVNPEIPSSPSEHKLGDSSSETSPIFSVPTKELLRDEISRGSLDHHAVESELTSLSPHMEETSKSQLSEIERKSSLSECKQTALLSTKESTSSIAKSSEGSLDFNVGLVDPEISSSSSEHKLEDSSSKTTPISCVPAKDALWDEISRGSLDHGAMESELQEELVSNIAKSSPVSLDVCEMQSDTKISLQTTKKRTERSLSDDKHIASPLTKASTSSISKSSQDSLNLNVVEAEVKSSPKSLKQRSKSLLSECKRTALLSTKESTSSIAKSSEANLDLSVGLVNPEIPSSPSEHKLGDSSSETSPIFSVPTKELLRDEISRGSLDHHAVESELTSLSPHMEETSKSQLSEIERKSSLSECKQTALLSTKESTSSIAKSSEGSLDFNVGLVDPEIPSSSSDPKLEDSSSQRTSASSLCECEFKTVPSTQDYSSSSHGSLRSSGSSEKGVDLRRKASFTTCAGSWSSLQSSLSQGFLNTLQEGKRHEVTDSDEEFYSADEDEKGTQQSVGKRGPGLETRDQSHVEQSVSSTDDEPRDTAFPSIVIANAKKVAPEGGIQNQSQLPIQNYDQSASLPAIQMVRATIQGPETVRPDFMIQTESDDLTRSPRATQDVTETVSLPTTAEQALSLPPVAVGMFEKTRKVIHETSDEPEGHMMPSGSFDDDSLPLHKSIQELEKSHSSSLKLRPVKPKIPQIPEKVKRAFKFFKHERERKQYSKFPQEGSSGDSDDVTEGQQPTPPKRLQFFVRMKKGSSSRGEMSRQDSTSHKKTICSDLPRCSTKQENAPVMTDQNLPSDQTSPRVGWRSSQVTGADKLTEDSIDNLQQTSSEHSKSSESGNSTTSESMDKEEFEHKKSIETNTHSLGQEASLPPSTLSSGIGEGSLVSLSSVRKESRPPSAPEKLSSESKGGFKEGITQSEMSAISTSYVPRESEYDLTNPSLPSSESLHQEKPFRGLQSNPSSQGALSRCSCCSSPCSSSCSCCSSDSSGRSTSYSSEDVGPLRRSKPCVVLSDPNIPAMYLERQTCGSSSSASSAYSATGSVSQFLLPRGSPLAVEPSVYRATSNSFFGRKRSVETISHSETSETDLSTSQSPLSSSDAESSQHVSPAWSRRDSIEQLSLDESHENLAEVSSSGLLNPEFSSPRAKRQETSYEDIGMLVSSVDSLHVTGRSDDEHTSSDTDD